MRKKGQAAMEFLMTYGWAILIVLIAIGALAFFGVLNPAKFLPQSCVLGPGLACEDFKISTEDKNIYINIRNGMGKDLDIFAIYVAKKTYNSEEVCGGMAGQIAIPSPVPGFDPYPLFLDGSARALQRGIPFPIGNGINCDQANVLANCCSFNGLSQVICGFGNPATCVCADGATPYSCIASSSLPTKAAQKFNQDIVIVYRERGSSILHQRIGRLTTSTE